jgi:dipeptidase E
VARALLTSNGLTSNQMMDAAMDLFGRHSRLAFIPTAATPILDSGGWQAATLVQLQELSPRVDIIDPVPGDARSWLGQLRRADGVVIGGGDVAHLLAQLHAGSMDDLRHLLRETLYLGISAGSIAAGPDIRWLYRQYEREVRDETAALSLVAFDVFPHAHGRELRPAALAESSGVVFEVADGSGLVVNETDVTAIGHVRRRSVPSEPMVG